jgi:hypothetical protein
MPLLQRSPTRRLSRLLALTLSLAACARPGPAAVAPVAHEGPWPAQLDHASTPETHRLAVYELLTVMHMQEQLSSTLDIFLNSQLEANPNIRPFEAVMRTFLMKYLSLDAIREPMAALYMARFSELDIVQITSFYRTPLGQRSVSEFPKMMEEGSKLGRRLVEAHMPELQQMILDQIQRDGGAAGSSPPTGR